MVAKPPALTRHLDLASIDAAEEFLGRRGRQDQSRPLSKAAWDERLAASRTACSAQSAFRCRELGQAADEGNGIVGHLRGHRILGCRRPRGQHRPCRSWLRGESAGGPPICTGVAAPRLVPGAIAATWVA